MKEVSKPSTANVMVSPVFPSTISGRDKVTIPEVEVISGRSKVEASDSEKNGGWFGGS